ncbi:MAG TPA: DUF5985 family protein [Terracidiphilus sp.]|jgi:hypothetical protein|nr:DUF5985 family protein [Terracidiphilus sp.]
MNSVAPLVHPVLDIFLLGFIAACSLMAALFFLRFWRSARDPFFLAFAAFFLVQGIGDTLVLGLEHPNAGSFWLFLIRLLSVLGLLAAILWKNVSGR